MHALNRVFADGFVLVHENGGQDLWSYYCPFVKVTVHRGCVAPAEQTVMGLGVAGAIGAKLARPDADVVCVTGDGAFQMYMKEIPTALQHSAPVLWVVLDNAGLHWVKWIARATGERYLAVDFDVQPDLAAVAAASGAHAERIGSPEELDDALERARARCAMGARRCWCARSTPGTTPRIRRVPSRRLGSRATGRGVRHELDRDRVEHLLQAVHARGGAARIVRGGVRERRDRGSQGIPRAPRPRPARASRDRRDTEAARPVRAAMRVAQWARVAPPRGGDAAPQERPRRRQGLDALVLNTFTGDAETSEEVEQFKANARVLADEAQAAGIRLCIETDSNLLPTAEIGMRLLDEIGHDWIQINYDPGNVVYYVGARPEEDLRAASADTATCT